METVHPKIVRAWFDTVLNPIIDGVESEQILLRNQNLTWKHFDEDFVYLKSINQFVDYNYRANFTQFCTYNAEIRVIINNHDKSLKSLRDACDNLHNELKKSDLLKNRYFNAVTEYISNNPNIDETTKLNLLRIENIFYIADYMINSVDEMDSSYILSPIWNKYKSTFYEVLTKDMFKNLLLEKNDAVQHFLETVNSSLISLHDLRNQLSLKSGEPIVVFHPKSEKRALRWQ